MKFKYFLLSLLAVLSVSCVTSRKVNYWQEPDRQIPSYSDTLSYEDYRIRKRDRLSIYVYSVNEQTARYFNTQGGGYGNGYYGNMYNQNGYGNGYSELYTYLVDEQGNIQFPSVGDVPVAGMTIREVKRELEHRLGEFVESLGDYSLFSVDVRVIERSFSIIGPTKSGRFTFPKEKVTIFEALALMGDLGDLANRSEIMLIREVEDSTIVKTFDVRSKEIMNSEFYYIEPNDVIYIRYMKGYTLGLNHVTSVIGFVASTISFGVFVYTLVDNYVVRPAMEAANKGEGGSSSQEGGTQ